jgi:tRNA pseudouridine55 synthase
MTKFNNGFLLINKPLNWTSNDVVKKIKSLDKSFKIGHGGTLDPLATGILPILFNSATKYFEYFLNLHKIYDAEITFGISTDTYDLEGLTLEKNTDLNMDFNLIKEHLIKFIGNIDQYPPIYSAVKIRGEKLYNYARRKENVILKPRKVLVENIEILSWNNPKIKLRIKCGSGFYVRSFANDLGRSLKVPSVLSSLERVQYGQFNIINSLEINKLSNHFIEELIPINKILNHLPKFIMNKKLENEFYQGITFDSKRLELDLLKGYEFKIYNEESEFIGILTYDSIRKFWKPKNLILGS